MENNKIEIVERYYPKQLSRIGETYGDISEIADVVYMLVVNGKRDWNIYKTKQEAEEAALKLDTVKYLEELRKRANAALEKLKRFRFKLSELNYLYISLKHKTPEAQKFYKFIESANKDNHVIKLLSEKEQHKCYVALAKEHLTNAISEYKKLKKEYLSTKELISKINTSRN